MSRKIKVGFHVKNSIFPGVDVRFPEKGNPGMGGTQFTTIAVAYYLKKFHADSIEPVIFADHIDLLPPIVSAWTADSLIEAAAEASAQECDVFVFRSQEADHEIYSTINSLNLKSVARSNNTPEYETLDAIAACDCVKAHVCVGHEQLDFLRDHNIIFKSTRIFHPFNPSAFIPSKIEDKTSDTVIYLGSIVPAKGFHHLARVWPKVLAQYSTAKLSVIGSGKLYDRFSKLGKWGIAEETYEAQEIRPYLSDSQGNVHQSVCFKGLLGAEKIPILQSATVGVVNPTATTETFCSSALEIQACGTPVVTGADWGLLDTVTHKKTGLMGRGDEALIRNIVYLLKHPEVAKSFGENGIENVQRRFSPESSAAQWMKLFEDIYMGRDIPLPKAKSNLLYRGKFVREGIRLARKNVPLLKALPSLSELKIKQKQLLRSY